MMYDARLALYRALDAFAIAQNWPLVHEGRDQDMALPRLEGAAGPTQHQPLTLDGAVRTRTLTQITIVTPWGQGTAQGDGMAQALMEAFPAHARFATGHLPTPPTPGAAFRDQGERRQPLMLELVVFQN